MSFNVRPWPRQWHNFWLSKPFGLNIADQTQRRRNKNAKIQAQRAKLEMYLYQVQHWARADNVAPDALSRVCGSIDQLSDLKELHEYWVCRVLVILFAVKHTLFHERDSSALYAVFDMFYHKATVLRTSIQLDSIQNTVLRTRRSILS